MQKLLAIRQVRRAVWARNGSRAGVHAPACARRLCDFSAIKRQNGQGYLCALPVLSLIECEFVVLWIVLWAVLWLRAPLARWSIDLVAQGQDDHT